LALVQAQLHDLATYMGAVSRVQHGQPLYPTFETAGPFNLAQADHREGR
jgi:hypothetical protein